MILIGEGGNPTEVLSFPMVRVGGAGGLGESEQGEWSDGPPDPGVQRPSNYTSPSRAGGEHKDSHSHHVHDRGKRSNSHMILVPSST